MEAVCNAGHVWLSSIASRLVGAATGALHFLGCLCVTGEISEQELSLVPDSGLCTTATNTENPWDIKRLVWRRLKVWEVEDAASCLSHSRAWESERQGRHLG